MAGGILFPWRGKLRLNLSLLLWKHIVLTTVPSGKSILLLLFLNFLCFVFFVCLFVCLPCLADFQSVPWSNFDTIWVLHQTTTGWKRTLHSTYYPLTPNYEYPQYKTRFFLQSRWNVEGGKQREYWGLDHHVGFVHPSTAEFISWSLQTHLLISAPPPPLKPGDENFSPGRQKKPCIHSSLVSLS